MRNRLTSYVGYTPDQAIKKSQTDLMFCDTLARIYGWKAGALPPAINRLVDRAFRMRVIAGNAILRRAGG